MEKIITNNLEETQKLAKDCIVQLLAKAKKGKKAVVFALEGDLGSGKTTFAQGLAKELGIKEQITSPTFVLVKRYEITLPFSLPLYKGRVGEGLKNFYHIDCYRIEKPWQLQELGFEEIINNPQNIVAVEWPERISGILPYDTIKINFEFIDENRRMIIFENIAKN